jgi:hypothetical protein
MTLQEANEIVAVYMGWQLFIPLNRRYKKLWIHDSRIKDAIYGSSQSYVLEEYSQNKHLMLTEEEFKNYFASLNRLVDVWSKMECLFKFYVTTATIMGRDCFYDFHIDYSRENDDALDPEKAALIITAKGVEVLNGDRV